jgi:hypothetical protein
MKYTITVETEDEFERIAIINAVKNKLLIDELYNEVFRPVIKYSEDEKEIEYFLKVWEKVSEYLYDN